MFGILHHFSLKVSSTTVALLHPNCSLKTLCIFQWPIQKLFSVLFLWKCLKKSLEPYFTFFTLTAGGKCQENILTFSLVFTPKNVKKTRYLFTPFLSEKGEKKMVKKDLKPRSWVSNFTGIFTKHYSHILLWFLWRKLLWKKFWIFHHHFQVWMCMNYGCSSCK